jgi:tRNA(Arg) A34 adenosine deaminase TadA
MKMSQNKDLTSTDIEHLKLCLNLATKAVAAGDKPFGSILVNSDNQVIAQARNRVNELTPLAHPEYELALWAAENLSAEERRKTVMYTTGEHCPMCSSAHGWVGLGTIVYLSSAQQLHQWLKEMKIPPSPIRFYPVEEIIKDIQVRGPASGELLDKIKELHQAYYNKHSS